MTISFYEMALYSGALFVLFLTPGPVWVALLARSLSGGFHAAWPLALGVVIGDALWPLVAILGVSWLVGAFSGFMEILRWVAVVMFLTMGLMLLRNARKTLGSDSRLTKPGMWAGFVAGLIVILSNPKAILFYMGVLPGFFDLTKISVVDIAIICFLSLLVPFSGNLILALFVDRVRGVLTSPQALYRTNIISGCLLIVVAVFIGFTSV